MRRICTALPFALSLTAACGDDGPPSADAVEDTAPAEDADAEDDSTTGPVRCADFDPTRRALFGDLHVHTRLSLDANLQGTRLSPAEAYRFAKGDEVGIQPHAADGTPLRRLRLARPLDFAAVTDHAEFLGTVNGCTTPGSAVYEADDCVSYRESPDGAFIYLNFGVAVAPEDAAWPELCGEDGALCRAPHASAWAEIQEAAAAADDPTAACTFTSLVGYEWSGAPGTRNLHRNVIFATDKVPEIPASYFDEPWPEGLWARLRADCRAEDGCEVLAIPHNSNLSSGLMFEAKKRDGSPIDREFAEAQAVMEPLVEIMQHKGDSECLPGTPIADEYCSFEKLPYNTLAGANLKSEGAPSPQDFVRDALLRGMGFLGTLGVNPWKFGIMASTDTHLGTPGAVDEASYPGHGGAGAAARDALPEGLPDQVAFNPGGLVGVWAEENSREAIFAALKRKETWGTSGPRITVRLFGGDVDAGLCDDPALAEKAYAAAVPMGGTLGAREGAPRFLVAAQRDPGADGEVGAALARVQLIKGWVDVDGSLKTKVFEVAGGDEAWADPDPATCGAPEGGFAQLCGVVEDAEFHAARPAFWYARVLERPTCRWSQVQCNAAGIDCEAGDVPAVWEGCCDARFMGLQRERAWTSPIWWEPR